MQINIAQLNVIDENDYYVALTRARRNIYMICTLPVAFLENSEVNGGRLIFRCGSWGCFSFGVVPAD